MKLLLKQRLFSWFDSYDIYDEQQRTIFTVKGKPSWGHTLEIYDVNGNHIATLKQKVMTFLPKFEIYIGNNLVGELVKELTLFRPSFSLNCKDWRVDGNFWEWDYCILDTNGIIANIEKQILNWTDTYIIDVENEENNLWALMIVLAIDAIKCSQNNG